MASIEDLGDTLENCSLENQIENEFQNLPDDEAKDLVTSLKSLECPFTWKPTVELPVDTLINKIEQKIEDIAEDEEGGFLWRTFVLNLVLCYEYYRKGSVDIALSKLNKMENILRKGKENSASNSCSIAIGGVEHIHLSCSCFLKLQKSDNVESVFHKIDPFSNMNDRNKASIWGTRAAVYMEYGYNGTKKSLEYIEKAIKLDENEAEWHFLRGKALGRSRRIDNFNEVPEDIEIESLKRAVDLSQNVSYMIFLAQVYREKAYMLYTLHKDDMNKYKSKCENMNNDSYSLFKDALDRGKNYVHVNIRCAQNFLKFPKPFRDLKLAHDCILTALRLAHNNALVNHVAAQYYERIEDMEKAKDHYMKAAEHGAFGASMDWIKLNWKLHSGYDPLNWNVVPDYDIMPQFLIVLDRHKQNYSQHDTYCQIGSYWYFIRNSFKEALKWWKKPLDEDPASNKLKTHKCILIKMQAPVSIHDIIFDEARLQLKNESISSEDHELFSGLISEYLKSRPPRSPLSWRDKILGEIKEDLLKRSRLSNRGQTGTGREHAKSNQNWREEHRENDQNEETLEVKSGDWHSSNKNVNVKSNESMSMLSKNWSDFFSAESRQKGGDGLVRRGFRRDHSRNEGNSGNRDYRSKPSLNDSNSMERERLTRGPSRNGNSFANRDFKEDSSRSSIDGFKSEEYRLRPSRNGNKSENMELRAGSMQNVYGGFKRKDLGGKPSRNVNDSVNRDFSSIPKWTANKGSEMEDLGNRFSRNGGNSVNKNPKSSPSWRGNSGFERENSGDGSPRNGTNFVNRDFKSRPLQSENGNFERENLGVVHPKNESNSVNKGFSSRSSKNKNMFANINFRSRPTGDANGSFCRVDLRDRHSQNENQSVRKNFRTEST
ncbi:uncharacterized protein [Anabrus simplex]|uniref:uncharacterized protein n=1 Tax=Anabrus simplex TaxID=316456 RepID=UPI0035A371B3